MELVFISNDSFYLTGLKEWCSEHFFEDNIVCFNHTKQAESYMKKSRRSLVLIYHLNYFSSVAELIRLVRKKALQRKISKQIIICDDLLKVMMHLTRRIDKVRLVNGKNTAQQIEQAIIEFSTRRGCRYERHQIITSREEYIITEMANGKKLSEIANALNVSTKTIYSHKRNLMIKLAVNSRKDFCRLLEGVRAFSDVTQ